MAWVRVSDDFYDHPKFDAAGSLGIALWVAGPFTSPFTDRSRRRPPRPQPTSLNTP